MSNDSKRDPESPEFEGLCIGSNNTEIVIQVRSARAVLTIHQAYDAWEALSKAIKDAMDVADLEEMPPEKPQEKPTGNGNPLAN